MFRHGTTERYDLPIAGTGWLPIALYRYAVAVLLMYPVLPNGDRARMGPAVVSVLQCTGELQADSNHNLPAPTSWNQTKKS
jgi:hypothetical protein